MVHRSGQMFPYVGGANLEKLMINFHCKKLKINKFLKAFLLFVVITVRVSLGMTDCMCFFQIALDS